MVPIDLEIADMVNFSILKKSVPRFQFWIFSPKISSKVSGTVLWLHLIVPFCCVISKSGFIA